MDEKICSICKKSKPISVFRWKRKKFNERITMCDVCDKEYRAKRYKERKDKILQIARDSNKRRRERVALTGVSNNKRRCIECLQEKDPEEFRWLNKNLDRKIARCKTCDALYRADVYVDKKESFIASNKRQYKKLRDLLNSLKEGKPCADCGKSFPNEAMDFDHRDPSTKIEKVSAMVYKGSVPLLLSEVEKCDLVCAVCHRIRTKKQQMEKFNE